MRMVTMQSLQCNMCKGDIASSIQNEDFETFVGDQKCMGRICVPADIPVSQILEETFCKLCSGWEGNPKLLSERENNPEPLSEKEDRRYHRNSGLLSEREKITETLGCSFTDFSISGPQSAAGCFETIKLFSVESCFGGDDDRGWLRFSANRSKFHPMTIQLHWLHKSLNEISASLFLV